MTECICCTTLIGAEITLSCLHNICQACMNDLKSIICPICNTTDIFDVDRPKHSKLPKLPSYRRPTSHRVDFAGDEEHIRTIDKILDEYEDQCKIFRNI